MRPLITLACLLLTAGFATADYYNGYQAGYVPSTMLPTNQSTGSYSVQVISASFIHGF